jgi:hypothetical protein
MKQRKPNAIRGGNKTKNNPKEPEPDWVGDKSISAKLGLNKRTMQHWRSTGLLPYSKMGNKLFYDKHKIDSVLSDHIVYKEPKKKPVVKKASRKRKSKGE